MKQIVQNLKNGETEVVDVPVPVIQPDFLLVKTAASLVSSGTERMLKTFAEKSLLGKAHSRPDLARQVIDKAKRDGVLTTLNAVITRLDQPLPLGYSSSGTVVQVGKGIKKFKPGDRVTCAGGGFAVHAEYALVPKNLTARLPDEVDFESGAFATIGAIALNGIRLANPQVGDSAVIIGMGLLGFLTAQILKAAGCKVLGTDIQQGRITKAKKSGIQAYMNSQIVRRYKQLTNGLGFDHVFICADTTTNEPVELAGEITRDRGNVVVIGAVGMDIPRKQFYEKELKFIVSRSYGPGRYDQSYEEGGYDYPAGYVRWTEGRNLEAVVDLMKQGKLDTTSLISHRFPIDEAKNAYTLISGKEKQEFTGVIITYPDVDTKPSDFNIIRFENNHRTTDKSKLGIGVLGAGNYANALFLPTIKKNPNIALTGIISAKGLNAKQSAQKFGFKFAGSSENDIFESPEIDVVSILTQHHHHADQVVKSLQKGKHVFCEKPLAISIQQMRKITSSIKKKNEQYLTIGFNRRFAPYSEILKSFFVDRTEPLFINYRINAGFIPPSHWLHDPNRGGGRLIGEGCHFIDFLVFLVGQIPVRVQTISTPNSGKYSNDNFQIIMEFPEGSLGTVSYISSGNRLAGKEYIEVFGGGNSAILDDFRKLTLYGDSIERKRSILKQDKGHAALWNSFIVAILDHKSPPIPIQELIHTSFVVLACDQSRRTGKPIDIKEFIQTK